MCDSVCETVRIMSNVFCGVLILVKSERVGVRKFIVLVSMGRSVIDADLYRVGRPIYNANGFFSHSLFINCFIGVLLTFIICTVTMFNDIQL